jgi:hypothetical protein
MDLRAFASGIRGFDKLSVKSQCLLLAFFLRRAGDTDFEFSALEKAFSSVGLALPAGAVESELVKHSTGRRSSFVKVEGGRYSLSADGVDEVEEYLRQIAGLRAGVECLTHLTGKLHPDSEATFMPEVRAALDSSSRRSVVVMFWLVTVDHIQRVVLSRHLEDFNRAMQRRTEYSSHEIRKQDDFDEIRKEKHFIEILSSGGIVTHDVRKLLDEKLDFRNTCAHPNAVVITDSKVVAFLEDLTHNVLLKLPF